MNDIYHILSELDLSTRNIFVTPADASKLITHNSFPWRKNMKFTGSPISFMNSTH